MKLFKKAENTQAFLKAGIMGFAGDGKTFTATEIAIGMVEHMRAKGLPGGDKPVMFLDTETGSDWVKPRFDAAGIPLFVAKTRAFVDLITAVDEAEVEGAFLLIDSISHFWTGLCDEYAQRRNRKRGLEFSDWAWLKQEWRRFTDRYVNSNCHIILCGRAGYEYDFFEGEDGKKNLEKTGVKMKAEGETGYEPSILILMEKQMDISQSPPQVWRTATILKDRSTKIDGKQFANPSFRDFLPHIEYLNLGGAHLGVDTTRDNAELFAEDGEPRWQKERRMKEIALDEIVELLSKHHGGTTAEAKKMKAELLEFAFNTRSWERIKTFDFAAVSAARNALWLRLEGVEYSFVVPAQAEAYTEEKEPAEQEDVPQ